MGSCLDDFVAVAKDEGNVVLGGRSCEIDVRRLTMGLGEHPANKGVHELTSMLEYGRENVSGWPVYCCISIE